MIALSTSWSLGVLVGLPLAVLVVLVFIGGGVPFWLGRHDDYDGGLFRTLAIGSWVLAGLLVALFLSPIGFYPYEAEYHQWRDRSGVVAEVNKRLVGNGDSGMSEKIVVRYKDSDGAYGCEDTRCALVKTGDTLDLKCKRAWQYASVSGYDCRFVSRRAS